MRLRLSLIALIMVADQAFAFCLINLFHYRTFVISNLIKLQAVYNNNWAFDLGRSPQWLAISLSFVTLALALYGVWSVKDKWFGIGLALLAAGVASTTIDRLARGKVVDYLNLGHSHLFFNLSDVAGAIGLGLISISIARLLFARIDAIGVYYLQK